MTPNFEQEQSDGGDLWTLAATRMGEERAQAILALAVDALNANNCDYGIALCNAALDAVEKVPTREAANLRVHAYLGLAHHMLRIGDKKEALGALLKARGIIEAELLTGFPEVFHLLAVEASKQDLLALKLEALELYKEHCSDSAKCFQSEVIRAQTLIALEKPVEALSVANYLFEQTHDGWPVTNLLAIHQLLAESASAVGEAELARKHLDIALSLGTTMQVGLTTTKLDSCAALVFANLKLWREAHPYAKTWVERLRSEKSLHLKALRKATDCLSEIERNLMGVDATESLKDGVASLAGATK